VKIGILCYPTYGGSGVVATELGLAMARRGCQVHFVNHLPPVRLKADDCSRVFFHEVSVPNYPLFPHPPWTMALTGRVIQVIKEYGLDLIHAHYAVPHSLVAVMARQITGRVKVLTTLHGTDITLVGTQPDFLEITRFAIENSDAVTAVSKALARESVERFGLRCPVHTVYNFVDLEHYKRRDEGLRSVYAEPGELVLVHISNFRPVKRLVDVVEIFARVRQKRPAVLILAGDGPQRCAALARARALGVAADVRFVGLQQEIVPLLSAGDVFLLPSEKESFGLAALEAMACGVPVVGSDTGGLPEVVGNGGGILAPVGDTEAMAAAVLEIARDLPAWRASCREQAQKFSADIWVDKYQDLYRQVMES